MQHKSQDFTLQVVFNKIVLYLCVPLLYLIINHYWTERAAIWERQPPLSYLNFNTMKQSISLIFIILFLGSCVSKSKYEDLEMENYNLREEVDRLKNKNTDLNSTILDMSLQIEELQERIENDIEYASQARNAIESAQSSLFLGFDRIFWESELDNAKSCMSYIKYGY